MADAGAEERDGLDGLDLKAWTRICALLAATLYLLHGGDVSTLGLI